MTFRHETTLNRGVGAAVACAALGLSATAFAGEAPTDGDNAGEVRAAEDYASQAYAAYSKKDYAAAVALYLKAHAAAPSAAVLYNIAKIYDSKLQDRQLAMTFYRRYVSDPGAEPDLVRTANQRLTALREAEFAAQDATPESSAPKRTTAPTETKSAQTPAVGQPGESNSGMTGTQVSGLVVGTLGLVGLGIGAGFGLAAKSDNDEAKSLCDGNACTSQAGVDAAESASSNAAISTIGFAAGGALLLSGTILLLAGGHSSPEKDKVSRVQVLPNAGRDSFGVQMSGRWW